LLLDEHRQRPFSGSILQLGRSSIYFTWRELERWARLHGVELSPVPEVRLSHDPRLARLGCIDDHTFFTALGFDVVESCDINDWEGAEHVFDLNEPIPVELRGRFDAVIDPGSSPQIFHQPNMLRNLFELLEVGGRVIHAAAPSNNHVDLGFYMFSPTFFHDFYAANRFRIEAEYLCQYFPYWHRGRLHSAPWKVYRYTPGCLDHLRFGRFGGKQVAVFFVATRTADSTGDQVPQLGQYVHSWQVFENEKSADPETPAGDVPREDRRSPLRRKLEEGIERFFDRHPALSRVYLPVKRLRERLRRLLPAKMPPLVARY
jgi:hypothetical protein